MIVVFAGRNKDDASRNFLQQQGFGDDGVDRPQIADARGRRDIQKNIATPRWDAACIRKGEFVLEIGRKVNALVERAHQQGESNAKNRRK